MNPRREEFNRIKGAVWDWAGLGPEARRQAELDFRERPEGVLSAYRAIWGSLDVADKGLHRPL